MKENKREFIYDAPSAKDKPPFPFKKYFELTFLL